MAAGLFIG